MYVIFIQPKLNTMKKNDLKLTFYAIVTLIICGVSILNFTTSEASSSTISSGVTLAQLDQSVETAAACPFRTSISWEWCPYTIEVWHNPGPNPCIRCSQVHVDGYIETGQVDGFIHVCKEVPDESFCREDCYY